MALSCWALVSFGPQVCKGYGSFTFFLIYILGGVSGNLASFLHTPDPTVGGTVSIILQFLAVFWGRIMEKLVLHFFLIFLTYGKEEKLNSHC